MRRAISSLRLDTGQSGLTWPRLGLLKPPNVGDVARQNSRLSTFMLSANDGERRGENFSKLCAKKESAGKAGLREKG